MPWKDHSVMDERVSFIARLGDGEGMSELCREFGISRKTGYKFLRRYQETGPFALADRSRRPQCLAQTTDRAIEALILKAKEKRPTWGAGKLLLSLAREHPSLRFPARSTAHAILERHGMVKRRRRSSIPRAEGTLRSTPERPNDLWCADYKGQFRLGDKSYCYPLTITDHESRFLLASDAHDSTRGELAFTTFRETFETYGLPLAIRTDNGVPFSTRTLLGMSRLSVWWMRLGIRVERSAPGHPEHNGRHERMHRTMKEDAVVAKPSANILKQQDALEMFRADFNACRPHAGLAGRTPSDVYTKSDRPFTLHPPEPTYDDCAHITRVSKCGSIFPWKAAHRIFLTPALGYQCVGLKEEEDDLWLVQFMDTKLGYYDRHEGVFQRSDS